MRTVEAFWEKRNLGVSCVEGEVSRHDTAEEIIQEIRGWKEQYQVMKVPSTRSDLLFPLQDEGFQFIETQFATGTSLKKMPQIPEKYQKIASRIRARKASEQEVNEIVEIVKSGEIFSTDRIALDPVFGKKIAGQRYAYWIQDIYNAGGIIRITEFDGQKMGFSANSLSVDGKEFHSALGGSYPETVGTGLSTVGMCFVLRGAYESGASRIVSAVSSNNFPILKIHLQAGMHIKDISYVLVKHIK